MFSVDEIFKGSHSSNFFENKNNGKEDYENIHPRTTKPTNNHKTRNRGRSNYRSSLNKDYDFGSATIARKNTPQPSFTLTTTTVPSTFYNKIARRINEEQIKYESSSTTTSKPYNPYSLHIQKVTSTAVPFQINYVENSQSKNNVQDNFFEVQKANRTRINSFVTNPATINHLSSNQPSSSRFSADLTSLQKSNHFIKNSTSFNSNKFAVTHPTTTLQLINSKKLFENSPQSQQPQNDNNSQNNRPQSKAVVPQKFNSLTKKYEKIENNSQYESHQRNAEKVTTPRINDLQNDSLKVFAPRQNFNYLQNKSLPIPQTLQAEQVLQAQLFAPRGFVQNQESPRVEQTLRTVSKSEINTHSSLKKFSTLVPRDSYFPTTFKPSASFRESFVDPIKLDRSKTTPLSTSSVIRSTTLLSTSTSTVKPQQLSEQEFVDSEDGQYHPEIYEKSFYRNKVKPYNLQKKTTKNPAFNSGEDELLKAEYSQNIAAGANDLLIEKRKQQADKLNEFIANANPRPFSKKVLTTTQKAQTEKQVTDTDYNYQYYDSDSHSSQHNEYTEYEDFLKTNRKA